MTEGKIHSEAEKALNLEANRLIDLFVEEPLDPSGDEKPFKSRRPVGPPITDKDMVGEPLLGWSDWNGRSVGYYFVLNRRQFSLRDGNYDVLRKLAERVLRTNPFKSGLSQEFVEKEIFIWARARFRRESDEPFATYFLRRANDESHERLMVVPIAAIEIEKSFQLGDVHVTTLGAPFFDDALNASLSLVPDHHDEIREHMARFRKRHLGTTAIAVRLKGESRYIEDQAYSMASDMAAVLRFLSPAAISPSLTFPCIPTSADRPPTSTIIEVMEGDPSKGITIHQALLHSGMHNYRMPFSDLDGLMNAGMRNLCMFFQKSPLSEHQKRVRGALLAYSRGIASYDRNDRLIYAMTAAEHLLLRDPSEPIQGNVGDRMAFLIETDANARKQVAANFKQAYQLRSKYVHHLITVEEDETLRTFFLNIYKTLFSAIRNMTRFESQAEFLDTLDQIKFS